MNMNLNFGIVCYVRDQTFIWNWSPENLEATLRTVAQFAADPDIDLNWQDAANIIAGMRHIQNQHAPVKKGKWNA